eukprot:scaffold36322_cov47-Attheya_sp.AAC.1
MPIRVTLRVKRSSPLVHERHPIAKKQRTTHIPVIHNITDGSAAYDNSAGRESALCQPSYDPHSLHKTSTRTSNQITSHVATADNGEISSINSSIETSLDCPPLNNGFTELPCEEELKYEDTAQTFAELMKKKTSWDERFKEVVDFKNINGHARVPTNAGPLGGWVRYQRRQCRYLKEEKYSLLTIDKREKLESIGFEFKCQPRSPRSPWDHRFQELVNFKKLNGHANVPTKSGTLGRWVSYQRKGHRLLKTGNASTLTIDKREKLESIGFEFECYNIITNGSA